MGYINAFKFTRLYIGGAVATVGSKVFKKLQALLSLSVPTIDIADTTVNIYDEEGIATSYDILVDGEVKATVSVEEEQPEVEMQTFTVINTNNPEEKASFTMPEGYTFDQFIGSDYDTSDGSFTIDYGDAPPTPAPYPVLYDYFLLYSDVSTTEEITNHYIASGDYYFPGEPVAPTDVLTVININNTSESYRYNVVSGNNWMEFVSSVFNINDIFAISGADTITYNGYQVFTTPAADDIPIPTDIVKGTYYYSGQAPVSTTSKLYMYNSQDGQEIYNNITAPESMTFREFIESEYDNTDGAFVIPAMTAGDGTERVKFLDNYVTDSTGAYITPDDLVDGTFYVNITNLIFNVRYESSGNLRGIYTCPVGYSFETFIGSTYDRNTRFRSNGIFVYYQDNILYQTDMVTKVYSDENVAQRNYYTPAAGGSN